MPYYVLATFVSCLRYNRTAIIHSSLFVLQTSFTHKIKHQRKQAIQRLLEAPHNGPRSSSTCSGVSCSIPRSSASCSASNGESESATSAQKLTITRRSSGYQKRSSNAQRRDALVEYLSSMDPFSTPSCPVCVESIELGRRDEWRARA